MMTREEHLEWAKARALEYVERGELREAVTSMVSDLRNHEAFADMPTAVYSIGVSLMLDGDVTRIREWVKGFG